MTFSGEIARFKVFPAGKRRSPHYWTVLVLANRGYMRKVFHQLNATKDHDDRFGAVVMFQEQHQLVRGSWKVAPSLGYALFAKTQLCMETQCHEAVHMALGYLRRTKRLPRLLNVVNNDEENVCYFAGYCASQLNSWFHKLGCYKRT